MSAPKLRNLFGLMVKAETTYGTAVSLAGATDGILVTEIPDVKPEYVHDGSRNGRAVGMGPLKRVNKSGRAAKVSVITEARGFGAAYSASNLPSIDRLLKAAGYGATVVTTGGAETVTYTPQAIAGSGSAPTSLTLESYVNSQKYALAGVYADLMAGGSAGDIPKFEFPCSGIMSATETDAAVPAITYPSIDPPKAETMVLTLGLYTPLIVKDWQFALGRQLAPRAYDNTNARHGGFSPGDISPTLEVVVEMVALATVNPWNTATTINPRELAERASSLAASLIVGSVQYNKYKLSAPQAQLVDVEELEDGPTSEWRLKFLLPPSTPVALDSHNWLFN
jgi:hypothetical protein